MKLNLTSVLLTILICLSLLANIGCSKVTVPSENVVAMKERVKLYPDYTDLVIPPNIAPMNFEITIPGEEYVTRVTGTDGNSIVVSGKIVKWDMKAWHDLLGGSKGGVLSYEVYVRQSGGEWGLYTFTNKVAEEEIDPYLSYRLIEPSYQQYSAMTINQRDLTSFREDVVFNNAAPCDERRGFCINCHVPRNHYKDRSSQFHVRKTKGGTVIMTGDSVIKVNMKTDSTLSAGVYPAWHPHLDLIAYSTNDTQQKFLPFGNQKVEVYDNASDLILYDMQTHEVSYITNDQEFLETFPVWHPDGKSLYYSVARYPDGVNAENLSDSCFNIRYDIVKRNFDPATRKFSNPDTVVYATRDSQSALLPRISPDGKYLLYCKAPYGTFHIWHHESDLYIKDLATGEEHALMHANSEDTDSYHTWSSNSRWVVFSSRRDDGSYTRPYLTYISESGEDSKAFVIPQESPDYYHLLMKSYNVPEFFTAPFDFSRKELLEAVDRDPLPVRFN